VKGQVRRLSAPNKHVEQLLPRPAEQGNVCPALPGQIFPGSRWPGRHLDPASARGVSARPKFRHEARQKTTFVKFLIKLFSKSLRGVGKERLLNKFHNAFGEIRENDSSFLQTLFN
jgi:hypothetical protein